MERKGQKLSLRNSLVKSALLTRWNNCLKEAQRATGRCEQSKTKQNKKKPMYEQNENINEEIEIIKKKLKRYSGDEKYNWNEKFTEVIQNQI